MERFVRQLNNIYAPMTSWRYKNLVKSRKLHQKGQGSKSSQGLRLLVYTLEVLTVGLVLYIVLLPFYPAISYKLVYEKQASLPEAKNVAMVQEQVQEIKNTLPAAEYAVSSERLIITKIGVNAPIVETTNAEYGLSRGAWLVPDTSTPDKGGNTVITGHRFKYLPPNNLTFYLFHKLEAGDLVSVTWQERDYLYRIREIKIVDKTDFSIMDESAEPILTLFTCHPIYSTEKRLVVVADLVTDDSGELL